MNDLNPKQIYVPILKAKSGELTALGCLKDDTKSKVIPLLEIPNAKWDFVEGKPLETTKELLNRIIPYIEKNWKDYPFFIDVYGDPLLNPEEKDINVADVLSESLDGKELKYVPVVSFDYPQNYNKRIVDKLSAGGRGCALRVTFGPESMYAQEDYDNFLQETKLSTSDVDLILDMGSVYKDGPDAVYLAARLIIAETPYIKEWRNVILSASSFPKSVGKIVEENGEKLLERSEWVGWKRLSSLPKLSRLPIYSDYSISHPEVFDDLDPRTMKLSGAIRYTTEKAWLIEKGERLTGKKANGQKAKGFVQFHELSSRLVESGHYHGEGFSWGDDFILKCSNPEDKDSSTGSLTTWRKVGNSQHMELVIEQLAKLDESA